MTSPTATSSTVVRPSFSKWPWPTHSELQSCWYICTTCWNAALSLEGHKQHCMTHHPEHVVQRQGLLTPRLCNFLEAASLCHEHWMSGSDSMSKCYQERISKPGDLPTDRTALLDNAASVYYYQRDGSVQEVCVNEGLLERLKTENSEDLARGIGGVADRIKVIDMLTSDTDVEEEADAGGRGQQTTSKEQNPAKLYYPAIGQSCEENVVFANIYKAMEEMHETDEESEAEVESSEVAAGAKVAEPEAGPFADIGDQVGKLSLEEDEIQVESSEVASNASAAGPQAGPSEVAAQLITTEMVTKALSKAFDKAARGQDWSGKRQRKTIVPKKLKKKIKAIRKRSKK